jgi:hypothetical protein
MKAPDAAALAEIKKRVLEDPNTAKLAETLGMTLEAYVDLVMSYVANPAKEAMMMIVSDDELRAAGYEPPNIKDIAARAQQLREARELTNTSSFADPNSPREKAAGKIPTAPAASAAPDEVREDLKVKIERDRTAGKFNKF